MEKKVVYRIIEEERDYQDIEAWPTDSLSVLGEMTLIRDYLRQFDKHYREKHNNYVYNVPIECMHDIRKMAAILIRCIEHYGVPTRKMEKHKKGVDK